MNLSPRWYSFDQLNHKSRKYAQFVTPHSNPSTDESDALKKGVQLLLQPLMAFLRSMEAARDLVEFIRENRGSLGSVEEAFVAEAKRAIATIPEETHREAAGLVHHAVHDIMDTQAAVVAAAGTPDEVDAVLQERLEILRADLLAITGRPADFETYQYVWGRAASRPDKSLVLHKSLLISAVSDFEILVYALVRAQLTMRPEILRSDEQKYSMRDLEGFATMDEFRADCAERKAESLLRGGFDDWMDWFSKRHKLELPGLTDNPTHLIEIFQRRHLLVHNDGVVSSNYLSKLPTLERTPAIGSKLNVPPQYLLASIDELTVAAMKLAFGLVMKLLPGAETRTFVEHSIGDLTYEMLKGGQYRVVEQVNQWALTFAEEPADRLVYQVNIWLSRKMIHGPQSISEEVSAWKTGTLAPTYRLAQLALLDQVAEAYALAKRLVEDETLGRHEWGDWPILANVRAFEATLDSEPLARGGSEFETPHLHMVDQAKEAIAGDIA